MSSESPVSSDALTSCLLVPSLSNCLPDAVPGTEAIRVKEAKSPLF
jgi:hypothetical protein